MGEPNKPAVMRASLGVVLVVVLISALTFWDIDAGETIVPGATPTRVSNGRGEDLAPASARHVADGPQTNRESIPVMAAPTTEPKPTTAQAPLGATLIGTVVGPAGRPVDDVLVWVDDESSEGLGARTNAQGRYSLSTSGLGQRLVSTYKRDYHDEFVTLSFVETGLPVRHDFVIRPQQIIRIRLVTSQGNPTPLASRGSQMIPVATGEEPLATFPGVRRGGNKFGIGEFWFTGEPDREREPALLGALTLHEDGPAWVSLVVSQQVLRKARVHPTTEELTFVVDTGDIAALKGGLRARLVDAGNGQPLAGQVWLEREPRRKGQSEAISETGTVEFTDQLPGKLWLVARAKGRVQHSREVELRPGETLQLGDIPLHAPVALRGRVKTVAGEPVEAWLQCERLEPGGQDAGLPRRSARSQSDGRFEVKDLEPGLYLLSLGLNARSSQAGDTRTATFSQRVDASRGSVEDIEIVMGGELRRQSLEVADEPQRIEPDSD